MAATTKQYARRDTEGLGKHYWRHIDAMTTEGLHDKSAIATELAWRDAKIEDLSKFKAYVHKRLDEAVIPVDPESPHKAEGCRIGGRLDAVLVRASAAPDLCVAAINLIGLLEGDGVLSEDIRATDEFDAARAAIAKAEGRVL